MSDIFENIAGSVESEGGRHIGGESNQKLKWKAKLLVSDQGAPKPLLANAITMLRHSPDWVGAIRFDDFASQIVLAAAPPWDTSGDPWKTRLWTSNDDIRAADWLQQKGVAVNVTVASQAVTAVADDCTYHPVLDYLDKLRWDGVPRLNKWITKCLGGVDSVYHSDVGRCSLIAAIARICRPGCKVDTIPILEGAQGLGKSTALRILFEPWFSDELADLGSKDAAMQLRGAWLIEISELDAMSRSDVGRIKAFASRMVDRFRPPYGSRVIESPRSCVFWGTTNSDSYLKDETGGRRFWPIKTASIDTTMLRKSRDQLWAEAQSRFKAGEPWWLQSAEVQKAAIEEQHARYVGDPWDLIISEYLAAKSEVSIDEILTSVIKLEHARWGQSEQNRVARYLRSHGWMRFQLRVEGKRAWRYKRQPVTD